MRIAGINSGFNARMEPIDGGGCAVIEDGRVLGAVAQERVTRKKHDGGYDAALGMLLDRLHLGRDDVDYYYLSFYGNPFTPARTLLDFHLHDLGLTDRPGKLVVMPSHHLSHAYAAFFLSPFEEALIVVADNEGNVIFPKDADRLATTGTWCERHSYYWAKRNSVHLFERDLDGPDEMGFGKVYNRFTKYIGFGGYHQAGKTMALGAYAPARADWAAIDLWRMDERGRLHARMNNTHRLEDVADFFGEYGAEVPPPGGEGSWTQREYQQLAGYVQGQLEKWTLAKVRALVACSGISNVCFSGGVALNAVANSLVERELGCRVFVPPFPSDGGQALGNAIYGYVDKAGRAHNSALPPYRADDGIYLGGEYSDREIEAALAAHLAIGEGTVCRPPAVEEEVARLLTEGKVVGWFQGRSEYGERALGNRSVLADPRRPVRDQVNHLKGREPFRPLAPSVLAEEAIHYFEPADSLLFRFMVGVATVRPERRGEIPAVVHADGSARVQTVTAADNPRFRRLIECFARLTGVPMVLNTSFNHAGEPIVETPTDALRSARAMRLDALALGDYLCEFSGGRTALSENRRGREGLSDGHRHHPSSSRVMKSNFW